MMKLNLLANLVLETRMHAFHEDIQCLARKRGTDEYIVNSACDYTVAISQPVPCMSTLVTHLPLLSLAADIVDNLSLFIVL